MPISAIRLKTLMLINNRISKVEKDFAINCPFLTNLVLINNKISEKIYSVDEAGDFVDIVYKGKKVSVRENYPYYSPQNDKIYYSAEEEAEDLYQMALEFD